MIPEDVATSVDELKNIFDLGKAGKGTQQFYSFIPVSKSTLHVCGLNHQVDTANLVAISDGMMPRLGQQYNWKYTNKICLLSL